MHASCLVACRCSIMKVLVIVCLLIHCCYCEIPPLQNIQGLLSNQDRIPEVIYGVPARPSPSLTQPQTQYGVPNRDIEPLNDNNHPKPPPSKVQNPDFQASLSQQQSFHNLQQLRPPVPQQQYGAPPSKLQNQQVNFGQLSDCSYFQNLPVSRPFSEQQYRVPKIQTVRIVSAIQKPPVLYRPLPQQQYGTPNPSYSQVSLANQNQNVAPQATYGAPNKVTAIQNNCQQQHFNSNCQNGNGSPINSPQNSYQVPNRLTSSRPNGFANQHHIQRPQSLYGTPNFAGIEPFDIKNEPSKFTQSSLTSNLNDYRTITQEALELYERLQNFPVARNEAFSRQNLPSIIYNNNEVRSFENQQNEINKFYPTEQRLPLQKSANFLEQRQERFRANDYPNGQSLPIRAAENFRQLPESSYLPPSQEQNSSEYPTGQGLPFKSAANFRSLPQNVNNILDLRSKSNENLALASLLTPHVRDAFKQVTHSAQSDRNNDREAKYLNNQDIRTPSSAFRRPDVITQKSLPAIRQYLTENKDDDIDIDQNAAVDTSVPARHFYLIQPDGTFQRVTVNTTQEPGGNPHEYTANYYFKNIPPVADPQYELNAPVIAIG